MLEESVTLTFFVEFVNSILSTNLIGFQILAHQLDILVYHIGPVGLHKLLVTDQPQGWDIVKELSEGVDRLNMLTS